jgi:Tol biopolymer transport system component
MARQSRSLAWGLATAVGLAGLLAGYVAHAGLVNHTPKQVVRVSRLTDWVGLEESPAISPDGKTVAFVATRDRRRQIWVRRLDGGTPTALTQDDADHSEPRWSPDSGRVIYYAAGNVWEIPATGGDARQLAAASGPGDWSHDGKTLAFLRARNNVVELVAGERVVTQLKAGPYSSLRWSPDDQRIAYLDGSALMVATVSNGELVRAASGKIQGFAWTPDGSGLIVSSAQGSVMDDPPTYNLWFVPRVGDTQSQLTFGEASYESPDVSASGEVVVSRVVAKSDIWKFAITGDPADNAQHGVRITRQTGQVQDVTLSPDETEVAFLSDSGGHANVWVMRIAGGEMRQLTHEVDPKVTVGVPPCWPGATTCAPAPTIAESDWRKLLDFGMRNVAIAGRTARSKDGKYLYAAISDIDSDIVMLSGLKWR